jgi:putative oxidoreductase
MIMAYSELALVAGRVLLALLFVTAAINKAVGPKPVLAHMEQEGVPKILLPLVVLFELGAGLAIMFGWQIPIAAGLLAGFCLLTAIIFHRNFKERVERTMFMKDLALAGGLAVLAAAGL